MLDIYTKELIVDRSKEHIVPNFLGGRLTSAELIDRSTNTLLGETIDTDLERRLRWVRVMTDARGHREPEKQSQPLRNLHGTDGGKYDVIAGGILRAKPAVRARATSEGIQISGSVPDTQALRNCLRKKAKKNKWNLDSIVEEITSHPNWKRENVSTVIEFNVDVYQTDVYRAVSKIACNLFAIHNRQVFLSSPFDDIRNFVLAGSEGPPPVEAVDLDTRGSGIGPLDHIVTFRQEPGGTVTGVVVIYGVVSFAVRIGKIDCTIKRSSYRVDQYSQQGRVDHADDIKLDVGPFDTLERRSYGSFIDVCASQMRKLYQSVCKSQQELHFNRVFRDAWDALPLKEGDEIKPEHISMLVDAVMKARLDK